MEFFDQVVEIFQHAQYLGIFAVLFSCGLGVPIPEEVSFIAAGYLIHHGYTKFIPTLIIGYFGVICGDLAAYYMGRRYGQRLYTTWPFSLLTTPKIVGKVQHHFDRHGTKTIFIARFLMGLRVATYFVAGSMRMKLRWFVLMDSLGIVISMPISVWLGFYFARDIDDVWVALYDFKCYLFLGLALLVAFFIIRHYIYKRMYPERYAAGSGVRPIAQATPETKPEPKPVSPPKSSDGPAQ